MFETIISQTNAAMQAEKNGHILGQWTDHTDGAVLNCICTCTRCGKHVQVIGSEATGYAIRERCSKAL